MYPHPFPWPPISHAPQTPPFLIRAFIKIGAFHRLSLFEDSTPPTTDEHQLFTWKDATLRELLTTLRLAAPAPAAPELRHPLARFSFRAVFADAANRGRFSQKDLGIVYSRDILGEPGTLLAPAARLLEDAEPARGEGGGGEGRDGREERSLEDLRFVPGDYLCIAVLFPKNVPVPGADAAPAGGNIAIKGSAAPNGWKSGDRDRGDRDRERAARGGDGGWGGSLVPAPGRGGGHWRGSSDAPGHVPQAPAGRGRGRGGGGGDFAGRDRRRDSPPHRGGGGGGRGGRGGKRSPSRSRSPPPRRRRD